VACFGSVSTYACVLITASLRSGQVESGVAQHQRTILLAHVFHQKPLDILAAELGTSRDAVYKAIHDARRKLRAALLARGVTVAEVLVVFGKGSRP
jgi:RNA polymerase sigma-70 factor (ECF subfamily)